jgi:hypothetical protein
MKPVSGSIPPAPVGYTFVGTIVVNKNNAHIQNALYTKN